MTATAPTGMLTRKIGRQSSPQKSPAIKSPPRIGPVTAANPADRPNSAKASPRSFGANSAGTIASVCGIIIAPPIPCTTRAATSPPMLGAAPHRVDPSVNTPIPARNIRLRPTTSPSRPIGSKSSAKVRI